jgi:hypothetical protein
LIIYNWQGSGSVSVDISSWASSGDIIEVRYGGNFLGDPVVAAFVYSGANLSVPMSKVPIARPIGAAEKPSDTLPTFGAFVLLKR